jgi:hypothetical protein
MASKYRQYETNSKNLPVKKTAQNGKEKRTKACSGILKFDGII